MSIDDYQPIPANPVMSAIRGAEPDLGEVGALEDEFARLSDTLRERARQVAALIERANAAEERCAALVQRQVERDRVIAELRDQLDQVKTRVVAFQESGARHLAEMQAATEDYARRVAASEQASEAWHARVAELTDLVEQRDNTIAAMQSLFAAQDERLAHFRQRAESAAAIETLLAESVAITGRHLRDLMALGDETERTQDHVPVPLYTGWATKSPETQATSYETPVTMHEAPAPAPSMPTQTTSAPGSDTPKELAQARSWYRRTRQSVG